MKVGTNIGSRRLLLLLTHTVLVGTAEAQCDYQKLFASNPTFAAQLGFSVAVHGDSCLGGARGATGSELGSGAGYLFERQGSVWGSALLLVGTDSRDGDALGYDVALGSDFAVIGAPWDDDAHPNDYSQCNSGSAYVFVRGMSGWPAVETQKLTALDAVCEDWFGHAVATDEDFIVVGAPQEDNFSGAVYVFQRSGNSWVESAKLEAISPVGGESLGGRVAVHGSRVVAGTVVNLSGFIGRVHVFEEVGGQWSETAVLFASDGYPDDSFGHSVAVHGDRILVGANASPTGGAAYMFELQGSTWVETQILRGAGISINSGFGVSVGLNGDRAIVGSTNGLDAAVHVYAYRAGTWEQDNKLQHDDTDPHDFARDVALYGESILVGKFADDEAATSAGALFAFEIPDFTTPYCFSGPCPCGNDSVLAGCLNATGAGALLTACGSTSVLADDFILRTDNLPPSQSGLFFMGAAAIDLPFGDGRRCVGAGGSGTYRYFPILNSGAESRITLGPGIVSHSLGFATAGQIGAGETWYFQAWYRDPQGPCGNFFNLSNGMEIQFQL